MANYWQKKAMNKRQKEKQVSQKTRNSFMDAYYKLREDNLERQRTPTLPQPDSVETIQDKPD